MKDQVTSIKQSKRLMELGVPIGKASFTHNNDICGISLLLGSPNCYGAEYFPAFTVADLMGVMPSHIPYPNKTLPFIKLFKVPKEGVTEFQFFINKNWDGEWKVGYTSRGDADIDGFWCDSRKSL